MSDALTITVTYSCRECGLDNVSCPVPVRESEDVLAWTTALGALLSRDHDRRSPHCHPKTLATVCIPIDGAEKIGGPVIQ